MTSKAFEANDWIGRVAAALRALTLAQEPYLRAYWQHHPREQVVVDGRDETPFPLDDVRMVYAEARISRSLGREAEYAPLRAVLDPTRYALLSHPELERVAVAGRIVGENDFWMSLVSSGTSISAEDLIAGLMARAAELPGDGFRAAACELNAFLSPVRDGKTVGVLRNLDEGCDVLLFYGVSLSERIEVEDGMVLLPYGEVLRFIDREFLKDLAPSGAGFHGWRAVGAVVRPFRWRPEFRQRANLNKPMRPTPPFFPEAAVLLDLLAVSHATRVAPLATLSNRIDASAGRLLGRETQSPGFYQSWTTEGFSGFDECPSIGPEALTEAQEAFRCRESARYQGMAPIVTRLSEALSRNGRFAVADRILDIAIALEWMYVLDEGNIGRKLRNRTARFLGTDAASKSRIKRNVKEFYEVRSGIVHSRLHELTPERVRSAFVEGFDLARQSLFKLLREGRPENWAGVKCEAVDSTMRRKRGHGDDCG